ncbi:hypothetical protein CapIbe_000802 [Capra ibex]
MSRGACLPQSKEPWAGVSTLPVGLTAISAGFPGGEAEAQRREETCPQTTWVQQRGGCGRWATPRRDEC